MIHCITAYDSRIGWLGFHCIADACSFLSAISGFVFNTAFLWGFGQHR